MTRPAATILALLIGLAVGPTALAQSNSWQRQQQQWQWQQQQDMWRRQQEDAARRQQEAIRQQQLQQQRQQEMVRQQQIQQQRQQEAIRQQQRQQEALRQQQVQQRQQGAVREKQRSSATNQNRIQGSPQRSNVVQFPGGQRRTQGMQGSVAARQALTQSQRQAVQAKLAQIPRAAVGPKAPTATGGSGCRGKDCGAPSEGSGSTGKAATGTARANTTAGPPNRPRLTATFNRSAAGGSQARIDSRNRQTLRSLSKKQSVILSRQFNIPAYGGWPKNDGFLRAPRKTTLQTGHIIDRYGEGGGSFASPKDTPFEERSLPTGSERLPYSAYVVKRPLDALYGKVAPAFGKKGMGMQYRLSKSIDELVKEGYLEKI